MMSNLEMLPYANILNRELRSFDVTADEAFQITRIFFLGVLKNITTDELTDRIADRLAVVIREEYEREYGPEDER